MEETSLDDFLDDGPPDATEAEGSGPTRGDERRVENASETGDAGAGPDRTAAATHTVTAAWSSEAGACPSCGEPSAWRWAQDDEMVCADCKGW
jgi:hypothetical protein